MPESTTDRHARLVDTYMARVRLAALLTLGGISAVVIVTQSDLLFAPQTAHAPLFGAVLLFLWVSVIILCVTESIKTMRELRHVRTILTDETEE